MPQPIDRASLDATVRELYPRIKCYFRSKIPEPDCYDQANETMRVFLSRDPATIQNPKSYLWGVARLHVLRYIDRRRPSVAFDSELHSIAEFRTSISVKAVRRNRLLNALATLPVDHETAFELHYAEGLTLAEVAEALDKSVATTKRYIADAKLRLAEQLGMSVEQFSDVETRQLIDAYRTS
jgi:RNA polymerase sigma factor (sigma-70 family)